jgi:CDP-paratose 2-epimerase
MKYLITGGCGFVGSNLAREVQQRGEELHVLDNLSRRGSAANLAWLQQHGPLTFHHADIRNSNDVARVVRMVMPDVIFHLAGQVAMTTSIADPRLDFEINVLGSHNVLETVRQWTPHTAIIYSSTNKVYGDLEALAYDEAATRYCARAYPHGFDEHVPLDFRSPYGCSKGAADQYMLDYARIYGLNTIVFRHSTIFGERQFATFDQGWIGWFVQQALHIKRGDTHEPFTISGDGKQVRDVLFARDLVRCYFAALDHVHDAKGHAFNIGGGMANSLSLLELFAWLEHALDITMNYRRLPWRQSDQKVFVADIRKATRLFGWSPSVQRDAALDHMLTWMTSHDHTL